MNSRVNRYEGRCAVCSALVPANGGVLESAGRGLWKVKHLVCAESNKPEVVETRTSSGWVGTRNVRGVCEDAPCCGCCTF